MEAKITCVGGAGEVTGACFMVSWDDANILIDCGLNPHHAPKFTFDPASIDAVFITHAHQDHIGRLPELVSLGFRGPIYMTPPTKDLSALMWEDALMIMASEEEEKGTIPRYQKKDVDATISLIHVLPYNEAFPVHGLQFTLHNAGHILGSSMIRMQGPDHSMLFTGDLGNSPTELLDDRECPKDISYLLMESVYGDRLHTKAPRKDELKNLLEEALKNDGTILIPAFSIERTQLLLYELSNLFEEGLLPRVPVFLDSPLATKITRVYEQHSAYLKQTLLAEIEQEGSVFRFPGLHITEQRQESEEIVKTHGAKIVIAGSGMSHGGRIRKHEIEYLPQKSTTIIFSGYQAPGSVGRRVQDGARSIVIDDEKVPVRAKVRSLGAFSGHPDRDGLTAFVTCLKGNLKKVWVTMGEETSSLFLAQRLREHVGVTADVPKEGEVILVEL